MASKKHNRVGVSRLRRRPVGGSSAAVLMAVAVLVAGCWEPGTAPTQGTAVSDSPPLAGQTGGTEDVLYVPRPGYEGGPASIGDPAAVITGPVGAPVAYGGVAVVPACSLVTVEDIRAAGGLLWPNGLASGIERDFFDGHGTAPLPLTKWMLPSDTERCSYTLQPDADRGTVRIEVYQPTYAHPEALNSRTRGRTPAPAISAATIHARPITEPYTRDWILTYRDVLVELTVRDRRERLHQPLLTAAAHHLVELVNHPTGPPAFSYDSPTMAGDTARACEVFGEDEFMTVFGTASSPIASEHIASSVGVIDYGGRENSFNYVTNTCRRRTNHPDRYLTGQLSLTVELTTYETTRGAETAFRYHRDGNPDHTPAPTTIGDDTLYTSDDPTLSIRRGRVIARIHLDDPAAPHRPSDENLRALGLVAEAVADRLGEF